MSESSTKHDRLRQELDELRLQLAEAQETLEAIRAGAVDAVVIYRPEGERVYTLETAERPYRTLIEQMQQGALTIGADRTVLYCNRYFADLVQRPLETIIGGRLDDLLPDESAGEWRALLKHARDGQPAKGECLVHDAQGNPISVMVSANIVAEDDRDAQNRALTFCLAVTDLTAEKHTAQLAEAEKEIRSARDQAEQRVQEAEQDRAKLEAMTAELRALNETLANRIAAGTAMADHRASQLRRLAIQLSRVEQSERRRLAQILHDHLQQYLVGARLKLGIARARALRPDVKATVLEVDELLKTAIEASRSLTVELSPPILYEGGLRAALEWLARQQQEKNGLNVTLEVEETADPASEELRVLLFQSARELLFNVVKHAGTNAATVRVSHGGAGKLVLEVEDHGQGFEMAPDQPVTVGEGGFGLFSIQERLEVLGGETILRTAPGKGTRVTLVVPSAPTRPAQAPVVRPAKHAEAAPPRPGDGRIRVLLADDHKIVREGLLGLLSEDPDLDVVGEASDGRMAVDLAMRLQPDVVVMDITMPRLNGIEATRQIAAAMPDVRVIGLSAHEQEDMARSMIEAGASAYLSKGGPAEDLIAIIRSTMSRRGG